VARRALFYLVLAACAAVWGMSAQQPPSAEKLKEEDTGVSPEREYAFNPLQAEKEIRTGDFYAKKKSYKAAAMRYEEATKWNPSLAVAWRKLAEMREKLNDAKAAAEAWRKYLEADPDAKDGNQIRKKIAASVTSS